MVGFWQVTLLLRRLLRFHSIGNHSERADDGDRGQEKSCHNKPPYVTTVGRTLRIKTIRTSRRIPTRHGPLPFMQQDAATERGPTGRRFEPATGWQAKSTGPAPREWPGPGDQE